MNRLPYQAVIFDLDGTLTQSEEGIMKCAAYALEKMGYPALSQAELRTFIGPPLFYSFQHHCGMTDGEAVQAQEFYRERYSEVGLFENRVYTGIVGLLSMLKSQGVYLGIATGKPQAPTERILQHFHLDHFFDKVAGPGEDVKIADKVALITKVMPETPVKAVMVGDRKFDILGARGVGIDSIGVGYGYGSKEELTEAGCTHYVKTVEELTALLCPGVSRPKGFFLSMEGGDGSGKSTQVNLMEENLLRMGYDVRRTREPGGCPISEKIRDIILDTDNMEMFAETEAILYAASRAQHVRQVIRPALEAGQLVLCDRYVDSSIAYQGGGRELGVAEVTAMNAPAIDGLLPDLTVYLEIDPVTALKRRVEATTPDRIEIEGRKFHARVEGAYHTLMEKDANRFAVIDASGTVEQVEALALNAVLDRMGARLPQGKDETLS